MRIQKRSFFEILLPLTVLAFMGNSTEFINITHIPNFRWVFLFVLCLFFPLNKNFLYYIPSLLIAILTIYLGWCILTSIWSEASFLSFFKSVMFMLMIFTMLSSGSFWILKFGYERCLTWLFPIVIMILISGTLGGKATDQVGNVFLYGGLSGNANSFGFLAAIATSFLILKCYQANKKTWPFFMWLFFLIMDVHYLMISYARSSIAIFLCILYFFLLSLPIGKKVFITIFLFFIVAMAVLLMPLSFLEQSISNHIVKGGSNNNMLSSRTTVWQKSYQNAVKGGVIGVGFAATVGDKNESYTVNSSGYGREKGNSQLAIVEETGLMGLVLQCMVLIVFFIYALPFYHRLKGSKKVTMGLLLGLIFGLLAESLSEAWWDSLGPEVIIFWTVVGAVFGMIYLEKKMLLQKHGY